MLLEDLFALPVGTPVYGEIDGFGIVEGIVDSHPDGARFIRWADGFVTVPFGRVRDVDEYIAASTNLAPANQPAWDEQELSYADAPDSVELSDV